MQEIWKPVKGYEGIYEVSNLGRVKSLPRTAGNYKFTGRILKQFFTDGRYYYVGLSQYGKSKNVCVHRLVAEAFVPNPDGKETVNHINEDTTDNRACNLEWLTRQENLLHGTVRERRRKTLTEKIGVPVYKLDKDGRTVLERFDSTTLAAESVGTQPGSIWSAATRKGFCKGYKWIRQDVVTENDLLFWHDTGERLFGHFRGENSRKQE